MKMVYHPTITTVPKTKYITTFYIKAICSQIMNAIEHENHFKIGHEYNLTILI